MGIEIEKKFLVQGDSWKDFVQDKFSIKQGYLNDSGNLLFRIRIQEDINNKSTKYILNIKTRNPGMTRSEWECPVSQQDAEKLYCISLYTIEKMRNTIYIDGTLWEVDEFKQNNLVIAEVELVSEDQKFIIPEWVSEEVTNNQEYYSYNLAKRFSVPWGNYD